MDDPGPSTSLTLQFVFLGVLILINAFFAAAEMAIVSVNRGRIKQLAQNGDRRALLLLRQFEHPNKFLSTIQVAITLAGFLASASAATALSDDVGVFLTGLGIPYGTKVGMVLVTLALSYVTLVFGELFPKRVALQYSERYALFSVRAIWFMSKLSAPFVWLLSASVSLLLKLARLKDDQMEDEYSEDEIKSLLAVGHENGLIDETGRDMIASVFDFDDTGVFQVMTPRTSVYAVNLERPASEYMDELLDSRYSSIPVYEHDLDHIVGILKMKDLFQEARRVGFDSLDIRPLLHEPYFVPETKKIDDLFKQMRRDRQRMAVVLDEYGGFSGLITMTDLIREVMGDVGDEPETNVPRIEQVSESVWKIDGQYRIDELNDALGLALRSDDHATIGGFVVDAIGDIPSKEDESTRIIEADGCRFTVCSVENHCIKQLQLELLGETG